MENTVPKIGFDLSGLEILIIGAKLGIGLSLAEVCAAQGARLVLVDIESPVDLAKNLENTFKTRVIPQACDRIWQTMLPKSVHRQKIHIFFVKFNDFMQVYGQVEAAFGTFVAQLGATLVSLWPK